MKSSRILRTLVFVVFLTSQFFIVTNSSRFVVTAFACNTWQVGARIGLRGGSEIRSGSGLNYQVHTIVPEDNWQVDIIDGPRNADGKEWWDISRQNLDGGGTGWIYKEQAGYDLCNDTPSNPGQIELMDNLSLWSDGSGQWPPVIGDKLVAHIKVRNSGGETLSLGKIGVRGRKNGGEFWDIGWWSADLGAGQEWQLDPNNERPLEAGNYSFRISYQDNSGWHEIGNEINFSVSASVPSNPGQLKLMDNLSLWSDGSGQWPPVIGDKLVAHIKVRNNGGEEIILEHLGVRGRKNGSENWDIGWWSADLGVGQEWQLDPNNEHPLEAGHYSFRISYQDKSGWHEIGNEIKFSVGVVPATPEDAVPTEAPVPNQPEEPNSYSSGDWQTGARVGLCAGAPIRSGSGFSYPTHTIVPENNWQVDIIEGPRNNGGMTWWNVSRANIDGGGTGWVFYEQAGICDTGGEVSSGESTQNGDGENGISINQVDAPTLPTEAPQPESNDCGWFVKCAQAAENPAQPKICKAKESCDWDDIRCHWRNILLPFENWGCTNAPLPSPTPVEQPADNSDSSETDLTSWLRKYGVTEGQIYSGGQCTDLVRQISVAYPGYGKHTEIIDGKPSIIYNGANQYIENIKTNNQKLPALLKDYTSIVKKCDIILFVGEDYLKKSNNAGHTALVWQGLNQNDEITILEQNFGTNKAVKTRPIPSSAFDSSTYIIPSECK